MTKYENGSPRAEPRTNQVVLHVWAETEAGRPVRGLLPDDFQVYEEGRRRHVAFFAEQSRNSNLPASIVVAVDTHGLRRAGVDRLKETLWRFVKGLPANTELSVVAAGGDAIDGGALTEDRGAADERVAELDCSSSSHLGPLLAKSLGAIDRATRLRKILIVVHPGPDREEAWLTDELRERLRATLAVLFVVRPRSPLLRAEDLSRLANDTGGKVFTAAGPRELPRSFRSLLHALRYHYVLGYFAGRSGSGRCSRSLEVLLREGAAPRGSVVVRTRRHYLG